MEGQKESIGERFVPEPGPHEITVFFSGHTFDRVDAEDFVRDVAARQDVAGISVAFEQDDTDSLVWRCVVRAEDIGFREAEQLAAALVSSDVMPAAHGRPTIVTDLVLRKHNIAGLRRFKPVTGVIINRGLGGVAAAASGHSQPPAV